MTARPSRKFAVIGVSMISPDGLAIKPRMPAELADLPLRTARAGVGHDVDRVAPGLVQVLHLGEHLVGDLFGDVRPHGDDLVVALAVGDRTFEILAFDLDDLVSRPIDERRLLLRE